MGSEENKMAGQKPTAKLRASQGSADLCVLARPHLYNPYFTLHAAAEQQHHSQYWPPQYGPGKPIPREKLRWFERAKEKERANRPPRIRDRA